MIQPILIIFLILPIIVGILSVDINGNRFSVREAIKDNFMTEPLTTVFNAYIRAPVNQTGHQHLVVPPPPTIVDIPTETDKKIDEITSQIANGIIFLFIQSREFGVWMGIATAPFHYILAVVIGFSFVFPITFLYMSGFLYIIVKERKEILHEILNAKRRVAIQ